MEVIRSQVELSVCDSRAAGTGDPVAATLGEGTVTWLDHPGPDFQRGGRYRYDLLLDGARSLSDIRRLEITKAGTDDLCLSELQLIVNGKPIFSRTFAGGVWVRRSFVVSGAELRANASWQSYDFSLSEWVSATGAAITHRELVERVESGVATAMHEAGLAWNDRAAPPLAVLRKDDATLSVSAELVREVPYWFDQRVVLTFELSLCNEGQPEATARLRSLPGVDEQTVNIVRTRLARAQMLVLSGGVCPRIDGSGNVVY